MNITKKIQYSGFAGIHRLVLAGIIIAGIFSFGTNAFAVDLTARQDIKLPKYPAVMLIHEKIEKAGIPIDGVSGWPVKRIDFTSAATDEQMQQAWEIATGFDYEKALDEIKAGEGLITSYGGKVPELTEDGQISVANISGDPYIYFRANGEIHHILGSSSFEISPHETTDALTGEKMKVGDFVIGMIDRSLENGQDGEDSSLHGIWIKWDSVKAQLIEEIKASGGLSMEGGFASTAGLNATNSVSLVEKITTAIANLGIQIKDGIVIITKLATETLFAKTARIQRLEMVDKATGDIWCTWVENGDWHKEQGSCDSLDNVHSGSQNSVEPPSQPQPASEPSEVPVVETPPTEDQPPVEITPEITPEIIPEITPEDTSGGGDVIIEEVPVPEPPVEPVSPTEPAPPAEPAPVETLVENSQ